MKFKDYSKEKPPCPGWYVWRVHHRTIKDVLITFLARFRVRGAGLTSTISPEFDYWDGYKVHLPKTPIKWASYVIEEQENHNKCKVLHSNHKVLNVNSLYIVRCPFCKKIPELTYTGRFIGATPIDSDYWGFSCCAWAKSPRIVNPVELINKRNYLLGD